MWLTANVVSSPSSVSTRSRITSPALFTSTSTRGKVATSRAASARIARCEAKSATKSVTSPPLRCRTSARARSPRSRVRQTMATRAPARASSTAVSLPIPEVAPVTTQVLPFMSAELYYGGGCAGTRSAPSPAADLGQQALRGRLVANGPVGGVAGLALVQHTLELSACLVVASLLDEASGQLDARASEVRIERERLAQVSLGPRHVAAEHPGRLEVERPGQRQSPHVVGIELEDRGDLLLERRQQERGAQLALRERPAAEIRRVPEMRFRVARRHVDGPLGDVVAALVAGELGVEVRRPVVAPEEVGPRQQEERVEARLARDFLLEQIAGAIDAREVLVKRGDVLQRGAQGAIRWRRGRAGRAGRRADGQRQRERRQRDPAHASERSTPPGSGPLGQNGLHAVDVTDAVLRARNQAFLVAQDDPAAIRIAQLVRGEVVHDLALLAVDAPLGEDDVGVMATPARESAEPREELAARVARHVVDRAAGVHEIERPPYRQVGQRRADPGHANATRLGEVLRLAEPIDREVDAHDLMSLLGEVHGVAPLAAAEVEHTGPVARELGRLSRQL